MKETKPVLITEETIQGYGRVLSAGRRVPTVSQDDFIYWSKVTEFDMGDRVSSGVLICRKRAYEIKSLERHIHTPEILIDLEGDSYISMAKPEFDPQKDDLEKIHVFYTQQGEGILMNPGTWHWIPFPVSSDESKFLVIFSSGTEGRDLEIRDLHEPLKVIH